MMAKKGKAGGYIPNFNALHNAVMRERSAGVPANRIRVGSSPSLASGMNPMGLGVWNTRDEPRGLRQGISRSLASGRNPKAAGIPNFALGEDAATKGNTAAMDKNTQQALKMSSIMMGMSTVLSLVRNSLDSGEKTNHKLISGLGALETAMMTVMMGSMMGGMFPKLDAAFTKKRSLKGMFGGGAAGPRALHPSTASMPTSYLGPGSGRISDPGRKGSTRGWMNKPSGWFTRGGAYLQGASQIGGAGGGSRRLPSQFISTPSKIGGALGKAGKGIAGVAKGASRGLMAGAAGMGPLGTAAIGYAAYQGISTLANETFNSSFNELKDASSAFEKVAQEAEKNIGSLTKFGDAAEQASQVFHDSNASMGQVMKAQEQMRKAAQNLPAEIRSRISGIVDPKQIQAVVQEGIEQEQRNKQAAQTRVDVAQAVRDIRKSDFAITGTGLFDSAATTRRKEGADLRTARGVARTALSTLSDKDINEMSNAGLLNVTEALSKADSSEASIASVSKALGNLGVDQTVIDSLTKGMEEGDYAARQMAQGMLDELLQRRKFAQEEKALAPVREAMIKQTMEATRAINEHKSMLQLEQKIRKQTIKISSQAAGAFLTATGKIELASQTKIAEQMEAGSAKMGDAIAATQRAFGGTQLQGTAMGRGVQSTLMRAQQFGAGSLDPRMIDNQTKQLRDAAEQASGAEKSALESLASQLEALGSTSNRIHKENQKMVYETRKVAAAQKAAARQQQRLKSFGGSQAILDPSSLSGTINQITAGEKAMGISARAGSRVGFDRGQANRLSGLQDLMGGQLPEHMVAKGRAAAERVKLHDVRLMNRRFNMGMSEKDMRQTAKDQAGELFKSGNPLDRNNKGLESLNTTMTTLNTLLSAAQGDRVFIGNMQQQAAMQASQREQNFAAGHGDIIRGAGREFAGLQGYGAAVASAKGQSDMWGGSGYGWGGLGINALAAAGARGYYNVSGRRAQNDQIIAQQRAAASHMMQSNQNNQTTVINVNGIRIQGDQEAQRRTEAMIRNMAQYDPNLRRYMNQQNYQRGR